MPNFASEPNPFSDDPNISREPKMPSAKLPKPVLASKLNWQGILLLAIALVDVAAGPEGAFLGGDVARILTAGSGFLTIILRTWFTDKAVTTDYWLPGSGPKG